MADLVERYGGDNCVILSKPITFSGDPIKGSMYINFFLVKHNGAATSRNKLGSSS